MIKPQNEGNILLAIVIPAFKKEYFETALHSLANQTNKNFNVYVGDDNSPFDLAPIAERFAAVLNLHYTKFENNIGSKNLVAQWNRCVNLTRDEEWLWLFSDDDVMEVNCVQNFYDALALNEDRFDVYRFNVDIIDNNGKFINDTPRGPIAESSVEMAYHLLLGERGNSMPDHIFTKKVFLQNQGFVFTEFAQGADWASSILFSKDKGIYVIPGAKVYWRYSGTNISSIASSKKTEMFGGFLQFIDWTFQHFKYLKTNHQNITYEMMFTALRINLRVVTINHYKGLNPALLRILFKFYLSNLGLSYLESALEILKVLRKSLFLSRQKYYL